MKMNDWKLRMNEWVRLGGWLNKFLFYISSHNCCIKFAIAKMDDDFCLTAYVWYFMGIAVDRHFNIPNEVSTAHRDRQAEVSKMNEWFYDKLLSKSVNSFLEMQFFPFSMQESGTIQCWWFHFKCENWELHQQHQ